MNLLANAIDALEEANKELSYKEIELNPNRIVTTTYLEDNYIKISIADNGKGMSEEIKYQVFDHLFTTK
jgi:signal transduction histidine kinase